MPKDKFAQSEHLSQYFFNGAKVLELFSCYESILPGFDLDTTVGVGWYGDEMKANGALDDYIEQDITVDPFLPLADNYFDFVVVPAMFQLFQRPQDTFKEINRVLKPGIIAVRLIMMMTSTVETLGTQALRFKSTTEASFRMHGVADNVAAILFLLNQTTSACLVSFSPILIMTEILLEVPS